MEHKMIDEMIDDPITVLILLTLYPLEEQNTY